MPDVYCRVCGEPWGCSGINYTTTDVPWWVWEQIIKGMGCPCCATKYAGDITHEEHSTREHRWRNSVRSVVDGSLSAPWAGYPDPVRPSYVATRICPDFPVQPGLLRQWGGSRVPIFVPSTEHPYEAKDFEGTPERSYIEYDENDIPTVWLPVIHDWAERPSYTREYCNYQDVMKWIRKGHITYRTANDYLEVAIATVDVTAYAPIMFPRVVHTKIIEEAEEIWNSSDGILDEEAYYRARETQREELYEDEIVRLSWIVERKTGITAEEAVPIIRNAYPVQGFELSNDGDELHGPDVMDVCRKVCAHIYPIGWDYYPSVLSPEAGYFVSRFATLIVVPGQDIRLATDKNCFRGDALAVPKPWKELAPEVQEALIMEILGDDP